MNNKKHHQQHKNLRNSKSIISQETFGLVKERIVNLL